MRLRIVSVTVAASLALVGLTSCRTNVGTAARVDGQRISDSDVNDFVRPGGATGSQPAGSPRSQVLSLLIQEQVFEKTLDSLGLHPSDGALAAGHDEAAGVLLQTDLRGADLDAELRKQLPVSGIKAGFAATFLRVQELEYTIIKAEKLTALPQLLALIKKAKVSVDVSARYGTWDAQRLTLDGKVALPSYLTQQPAASAQAQPAG